MIIPASYHRKLGIGILIAAISAIGLTTAISRIVPSASAASLPAPVRGLGFFPGYGNVSGFVSLEGWLGRQASYVVQFSDGQPDQFAGSVWGQVVAAGKFQTLASRVTLVESVPLAFGGFLDASTAQGQAQARSNLQATLNGTFDAQYRQAAVYLRDGGFPSAIIRLGWEFDGGWFAWSSQGNCDVFQSAFRRVHDIFTSVSPGFRFDWNATASYLAANAQCAWPGDSY